MKNHTHLIRLIVITAALIGLGVMAFKYLHTQNNGNVKIQALSQHKKLPAKSTKNDRSTGTRSQSGSSTDCGPDSCSTEFGTCMGECPCCAGYKCVDYVCRVEGRVSSSYETSKSK